MQSQRTILRTFQREFHAMERFEANQVHGDKIADILADNTWCLLCTSPQIGKTSILMEAIGSMVTCGQVEVPNTYLVTGMSDLSWKAQTRERVPKCMQTQVLHRNDLEVRPATKTRMDTMVEALRANKTLLLVVDEAHVASSISNTLYKFLTHLYAKYRQDPARPAPEEPEIPTPRQLYAWMKAGGQDDMGRVKLLLVSATPDGVLAGLEQHFPDHGRTYYILPDTVPSYVWMKQYRDAEILSQVHPMFHAAGRGPDGVGALTLTTQGLQVLEAFTDHIRDQPMGYSFIRPEVSRTTRMVEDGKTTTYPVHYYEHTVDHVRALLTQKVGAGQFVIHEINCATNAMAQHGWVSLDAWMKTTPTKHTVFVLKELARVSNTLRGPIRAVLDRPTRTPKPNTSTIVQSLVGRMCGHHRAAEMPHMRIWTDVKACDQYIALVENHFQYHQTGWTGYHMKTVRGTQVVQESLAGPEFTKEIAGLSVKIQEDEEVDAKLFSKMLQAIRKPGTKCHKIYQFYHKACKGGEGDITLSFSAEKLQKAVGVDNILSHMYQFTSWNDVHNYYKIVQKEGTDPDQYMLNPDIWEHLQS